jgi:hypothetical protein
MNDIRQSAPHESCEGVATLVVSHAAQRSVVLPILLAGLALAAFWVGVALAQAPADLPEAIGYDPLVADIIAQVTTPTLKYELEGLTGERPVTVAGTSYTVTTRNSYRTQEISMATRYAYEQFAAAGLSVTYHDYTYGSYHWRNVVAEKLGLVDPEAIYLITAHVDDLPNSSVAPGADDNGSGSVAVLMAARLLAGRHFAYTLRFVLFTGEEQGLIGSAAYAADCAARGEDIRGVINLDMIAYNSTEHPEPVLDLYARTDIPDSLELTLIFSDVIGTYGLNLIPNRFDIPSGFPIRNSDQWSFLQQGYPAFLAIEDLSDFTPYYHTSQDALSTLDLDYYADFTRAAIATLVHLGGLFPDVGWGRVSGTVTDLEAGQPLPAATVSTFWPVDCYTFTAVADASGTYTLPLPVANYTLTVVSQSYYAVTVTNVSIVTDTVTTLDLELAPWPRVFLPLVLRTTQ